MILFLLAAVFLAASPNPRVRFETSAGAIVMEVDSQHAPVTAANFIRYVEAGLYDGGAFHRAVTLTNQPQNSVKIEVIQAGPHLNGTHFEPIALERTSVTGLRHVDGVVSTARGGVDTATGDFFICIGDQPSLDFGGARNADGQGFAAFGRVLEGMDVVKKIQRSPVEAQKLTPPIRILKAVILK